MTDKSRVYEQAGQVSTLDNFFDVVEETFAPGACTRHDSSSITVTNEDYKVEIGAVWPEGLPHGVVDPQGVKYVPVELNYFVTIREARDLSVTDAKKRLEKAFDFIKKIEGFQTEHSYKVLYIPAV